jgi:hypothetical protein
MNWKELWGHRGCFDIFTRKAYTKQWHQIDHIENLIVNQCHNSIAKSLMGYDPTDDVDVYHLAVGNSATAPNAADVKMTNETYRIRYISQSNPSTGVIVTDFFMTDTEFSGVIAEIGLFGGNASWDWDGGTGKDSGFMLAHALWSYTKTTSEEILFRRTDTFT